MSRKQKRAYETLKNGLEKPAKYTRESLSKEELFEVINDLEKEILSKDQKLAEISEKVEYLLSNHQQVKGDEECFIEELEKEEKAGNENSQKANLLRKLLGSFRNVPKNGEVDGSGNIVGIEAAGGNISREDRASVNAFAVGELSEVPKTETDRIIVEKLIKDNTIDLQAISPDRNPTDAEIELIIERELEQRWKSSLNDENFIRDNILSNEQIVNQIIANYLYSLNQPTNAYTLNNTVGRCALTPLSKPKDLKEAKAIADKLFN